MPDARRSSDYLISFFFSFLSLRLCPFRVKYGRSYIFPNAYARYCPATCLSEPSLPKQRAAYREYQNFSDRTNESIRSVRPLSVPQNRLWSCSNKIKFNHPKCRCKQIIRNSKSRQRSQSHKNNNHRTDNMRINRRLTDNQTADNPQSTPIGPGSLMPASRSNSNASSITTTSTGSVNGTPSWKPQNSVQNSAAVPPDESLPVQYTFPVKETAKMPPHNAVSVRNSLHPNGHSSHPMPEKACKHSRQQKNHGGIVHNQTQYGPLKG